jgi:hypothetical protein
VFNDKASGSNGELVTEKEEVILAKIHRAGCRICGRHDCRCGEEAPSRHCPTHNCALVIITAPVWIGSGTAESQHWIMRWTEYLNCPINNCGYARALKAPYGPRSHNRKTTRKNK